VKAVKLDSLEGRITLFAGQGITALILWLVSHDVGIGARLSATALPFILMPILFLAKLAAVPADMAQEDARKITQLETNINAANQHKNIRLVLAGFVHEGEVLMARCRNPDDETLHEEANAWAVRVEQKLAELLDESYIPRFRSATGTPSNIIIGPGAAEHGAYWSGVRNRVFRLQEFIRETVHPGQPQPPAL